MNSDTAFIGFNRSEASEMMVVNVSSKDGCVAGTLSLGGRPSLYLSLGLRLLLRLLLRVRIRTIQCKLRTPPEYS